jgi:hypothetical protein
LNGGGWCLYGAAGRQPRGMLSFVNHAMSAQHQPLIARFPPVSPISLKIGEVHRKTNFSETQVDFLAGKIVFLVRASKIKIAPYP